MDYGKYIVTMIMLVALGIVYDKFKIYNMDNENAKQYDIVTKFFLDKGETTLGQPNKPIIWIHTDYNINANHWASFGSRNTRAMNQPYKLLTMKSIIDKCGGNFSICMIDDASFSKLLPEWMIDIELLADPIKTNIRRLGLARLLKTYGGMVVPGSMICLRDFSDIYQSGIRGKGEMFVGELMSDGGEGPSRHPSISYPSVKLMGCKKNSKTMCEYVRYLERLNSTDYTDESKFVGADIDWCMKKIGQGELSMVPGNLLGSRDARGKSITLEKMLGSSYVDIDTNAVGIFIPEKEIMRRSKYQWFARLSTGQVLTSDTMIGKYLVLSAGDSL